MRSGTRPSAAGRADPPFPRLREPGLPHIFPAVNRVPTAVVAILLATASGPGTVAADSSPQIRILRDVGPEGRGNAAASVALTELARLGADELPRILAGMNGADPVARNWLRAAAEAIATREATAGKALPVAELEKFLLDQANDPRARRLAYDWIARTDAPRAGQIIVGMLDDPAPELRRDAVQRLLDEAANFRAGANPAGAAARFRIALAAARDVDQIEAAAKALRDLGQTVDLPRVFGWLREWQVIGPFDNTGRQGFARVFPPEELAFDPAAAFDGTTGRVRWQPLVSTNEYGLVDLNKPYGPLKEVAGYTRTLLHVDRAQPAELRLGCKNAWKIWLNGRYVFGREEYHRGAEIDQYRLPVQLRAGPNEILVKICQNEQKEEWTVEWEFQLRVTDPTGNPIPAAAAPAP